MENEILSPELEINGVKITLCNEMIQLINDELNLTFTTLAGIDDLQQAFINNKEDIVYGKQIYSGYTSIKKLGYNIDNVNRTIYQVALKKPLTTQVEMTEDMEFAISFAINTMPDNVAVERKSLFKKWDDVLLGEELTQGERLVYNDGLWKVSKAHQKQEDWYPGADPTLFEQLDKEDHKGTLEDPIPVPDSVTTSGFTYIYGLYYLDAGNVYLCKRAGVDPSTMEGKEEKLFYYPSAVVGQYFELVGE